VSTRTPHALKQTPIFDTNVLADVQRGKITQSDWSGLLRRRPRHGWPLSSVTAFELLAGIDAASPDNFPSVKARVALAYDLCKGRFLEDPRFLICTQLLHIPTSNVTLPSLAPTLRKYMDVARRANSFRELVGSGVPYRGRRARINTTSILTEVMAGPKRDWIKAVEDMADERYPAWRDNLRTTGKRLPPEVAKSLQPRSAWLALRPTYVNSLLAWLGATDEPSLVDALSARVGAALEFVTFVTQEFLLRNYNLEKHQSDVFDHFQLLHLAVDRFVIVTADPDLLTRTRLSPQASRIMTFPQFLETL
jgi:hypothetical protein